MKRVRFFRGDFMILLTKLDDSKILVWLGSVKYLESVPDTLICFLNGDRIMVRETFSEVLSAVKHYNAGLNQAV